MPQTNNKSLAYPALLGKGKARINYDNLQYVNPINYEYIPFDYNNTVGKAIIKLPANSVLINPAILTVEEIFTPSSGIAILQISRLSTGDIILASTMIGEGTTDLGTPVFEPVFNQVEILLLRIRTFPSASATLSSGRGWLLLQWLNLNLVRSFRENFYAGT